MTQAVTPSGSSDSPHGFEVMPNPRCRYVERQETDGIAVLIGHDLHEVKGNAARVLRASLHGTLRDLVSGGAAPLAAFYGAVELLKRHTILVDEFPKAELNRRLSPPSFPQGTHFVDLLGSPELCETLARAFEGFRTETPINIILTDDYTADTTRQTVRNAQRRGAVVALGALQDGRLFVGPVVSRMSTVLDDLTFALRFNNRAAQIGGTVLRAPVPLSFINEYSQPFASALRQQVEEQISAGHCAVERSIIEIGEEGRAHVIRHQPGPQNPGPATEAVPINVHATGADDIGRSMSAADFIDQNAHLVSDVTGVVRELERLDDPGSQDSPANVYVAGHNWALRTDDPSVLRRSLRGQSGGKGRTDIEARAGGLAEAVERHSAIAVGREPRTRARFVDLSSAVHPNAIQLFSESQFANRVSWNQVNSLYNYIPEPFDETALVDFTPVWNPVDGSTAWVLTALCYFMFPNAAATGNAIDQTGRRFARADSNGYAAGATKTDAAFQGLAELIERDAVALWWYNRVRRPSIDIDSFHDRYLLSARRWLDSTGRDLWLLDLTTDIGVPVVGAVSSLRDGRFSDQILLGFGAHTDPRQAAVRAVAEVLQFRAAMPSEVWQHLEPGRLSGGEAIEWLTQATLAENSYLLPDSSAERVPPHAASAPTAEYLIDRIVSTGTSVYLLDATRGDVGVPVIRAIAPGLRPWWSRLAGGRLYDTPVALRWRETRMEEREVNPIAMFF